MSEQLGLLFLALFVLAAAASTRNHELLMHSHLFAAARGLLASGEQVIDVTFKFTFLRGEGWRAASGGGDSLICDSGY